MKSLNLFEYYIRYIKRLGLFWAFYLYRRILANVIVDWTVRMIYLDIIITGGYKVNMIMGTTLKYMKVRCYCIIV